MYYDPVKKLKFSFDPITLEARVEEENVDWETQFLPAETVQLRYIYTSHVISFL